LIQRSPGSLSFDSMHAQGKQVPHHFSSSELQLI
jgi:hypothetical protein